MIAVYLQYRGNTVYALHSAVVTKVSGSSITCQSKWGRSGLYEHALNNVPPWYCNNPDTGDLRIVFYKYTTYHTGSNYKATNSTIHTGTCEVCGARVTGNHIINKATGLCKVCGYSDPITITRTQAPKSFEPEVLIA